MITEEDWADIYELSANLEKHFSRLIQYDIWIKQGIPCWVSL